MATSVLSTNVHAFCIALPKLHCLRGYRGHAPVRRHQSRIVDKSLPRIGYGALTGRSTVEWLALRAGQCDRSRTHSAGQEVTGTQLWFTGDDGAANSYLAGDLRPVEGECGRWTIRQLMTFGALGTGGEPPAPFVKVFEYQDSSVSIRQGYRRPRQVLSRA